MNQNIGQMVAILAVWGLGVAGAQAEGTRFYELQGFGSFLDGNPESTVVTQDGAISLPFTVQSLFEDEAANFGAAMADGDIVYVSRTDSGQVLRIVKGKKPQKIFKADEAMVTALWVKGGDVFVAVSPEARIYRVTPGKPAQLYYKSEAKFIWDMLEGKNGKLIIATGAPGTVTRVDGPKKGEVVFTFDQEHIRSLAYDKKLGLFAGGGERGVVYRSANGKNFKALYDSRHPEVTALHVHDDAVYVAGVTGAQELAVDHGDENGKKKKVDVRSQLVRVQMDGTAETLAGSNDEAIFDLAIDAAGRIVVSTGATGRDDPRGRLYSIDVKSRTVAMVYQSKSRRISHLVKLRQDKLAMVSGGGGRIEILGNKLRNEGEFLTLPFDTGLNSNFGMIDVAGSWASPSDVLVSVRTGQTADPDDTWSDWSKPIAAPGKRRVAVPNGRYMQARVQLKAGKSKNSPEVYRLRLAYQRQNLAPYVRDVVAMAKGIELIPIPDEEHKAKTVTLDERPKSKDSHKDSKRARQVYRRGAMTVRWAAEDPNGDELTYDLKMRPMGQGGWRDLGERLEYPFYSFNSAQLPDGHYQFQVKVSDAPSNPRGRELTDTRESRAILIDNTAPNLDPLKVEVRGKRATVRGVMADAVGPLILAEMSVDGGKFRPIAPDDGILDGPGESFVFRLGPLSAGSHSVTLRVMDEAGNEGFAEASFVIK